MEIIRRASFKSTPWKNGGGITHEIFRVPAASELYHWRLSVAQVDASGPFSDFNGYERRLVLLGGSGMNLSFEGAAPVHLRRIGDMAEFDGGLKTDCRLIGGPCTDLNLMVLKTMGQVTATVERLHDVRSLPGQQAGLTFVVAISGRLLIDSTTCPQVSLEPWDTAILPRRCGGLVKNHPDQSSPSLMFCATLSEEPE